MCFCCAENAAEVAVQLAVITNNELSNEEVGTHCGQRYNNKNIIIIINDTNKQLFSSISLQVSKVVTKVKELVTVAKINGTLASTVVTIISNVMTSSETALAATSEKYGQQPSSIMSIVLYCTALYLNVVCM